MTERKVSIHKSHEIFRLELYAYFRTHENKKSQISHLACYLRNLKTCKLILSEKPVAQKLEATLLFVEIRKMCGRI
jgi:hypothetical protein